MAFNFQLSTQQVPPAISPRKRKTIGARVTAATAATTAAGRAPVGAGGVKAEDELDVLCCTVNGNGSNMSASDLVRATTVHGGHVAPLKTVSLRGTMTGGVPSLLRLASPRLAPPIPSHPAGILLAFVSAPVLIPIPVLRAAC